MALETNVLFFYNCKFTNNKKKKGEEEEDEAKEEGLEGVSGEEETIK